MSNNYEDNDNEFDGIDNVVDNSDPIVTEDDVSAEYDDPFDDLSFDEDETYNHDDDNTSFDDYADEDLAAPPPSQTSKSGMNWFNIGIVAFVILGIAGITYMYLPNLLSSTPQQTQLPPETASPEQQKALAQQAMNGDTKPSDTPMFEGGLLNNPELLNDENIDSVSTSTNTTDPNDLFGALDALQPPSDDEITAILDEMPSEDNSQIPSAPQITETNTAETMPDFDTLPMPADSIVIEEPVFDYAAEIENAIPSSPAVEVRDTTQISMPEPTNEVIEIADEPVETPKQPVNVVTSDYSDDIAAVNDRIDAMNASMTQFMTQLNDKISNMAAPTISAPASNDNSDQLAALQKTVERLESKISAMESQPAPAPVIKEAPKPKVIIEEETPKISLTPMPEETPAPAQQKVASAPKKITPKATASTKAYVPPKPQYELRGASPGQAYIAEKGTQNLRTVNNGDVVRGLGTIQSISMENGRWVVRGSSGSVYQ